MANGMISVYRGHRQDIGTEIQAEWLSELDQFAEHCTTLKSNRSQFCLIGSFISPHLMRTDFCEFQIFRIFLRIVLGNLYFKNQLTYSRIIHTDCYLFLKIIISKF